jgi:hypothetical protein
MNSLVKTSKAALAVAMLSTLFACGQEGAEEGASGGMGATSGGTGAATAESGTGNPALDGILGGDADTAGASDAAVDSGTGDMGAATGSPSGSGAEEPSGG